jgi:hypothetical protein
MIAVITEFGSNKRDNQDAAGHTYGESGNIDKSVGFVFFYVSERNL